VCVNKMDLVDWSQARFEEIVEDFTDFAAKLEVSDVTFIPISALMGDNVVERSAHMPWYAGPPLLYHLEHVHIASDRNLIDPRFPVQWVVRPGSDSHHDYRAYAGQVASGIFRAGDEVVVLPSGARSTIAGIDFAGKELTEAFAPQSVTLRLADDIDISRGDLLVTSRSVPPVTQDIDGTIAWLAEGALVPGTKVLLKHGTKTVQAMVKVIGGKLDLDNARLLPAESLGLNDIGHVTLRLAAPIPAEEYIHARGTGAFLLIDAQDGGTLAAGMVGDALLDTKAAVEAIGETTVLV